MFGIVAIIGTYNGIGGFAAALLAKGQALKAAPEEKKPANAQSDLLQQIRSGISLKQNAQTTTATEEKQAPQDILYVCDCDAYNVHLMFPR